jgi:hypothetical protein
MSASMLIVAPRDAHDILVRPWFLRPIMNSFTDLDASSLNCPLSKPRET